MSTDSYEFSASKTVRLTRASRARFRAFWRRAVVEKSTKSPSRTIQTTEVCGPPSGFSVATVATFLPSSSLRVSSLNVTGTASPVLFSNLSSLLALNFARGLNPSPHRVEGRALPATTADRLLRRDCADLPRLS
jgi:hypothetical protein